MIRSHPRNRGRLLFFTPDGMSGNIFVKLLGLGGLAWHHHNLDEVAGVVESGGGVTDGLLGQATYRGLPLLVVVIAVAEIAEQV